MPKYPTPAWDGLSPEERRAHNRERMRRRRAIFATPADELDWPDQRPEPTPEQIEEYKKLNQELDQQMYSAHKWAFEKLLADKEGLVVEGY